MGRFIILLLVYMSNMLISHSQTLTGIVYGGKTKKPVADATVYLDGTMIRTKTDARGAFEITVDRVLNTSLIVSHLAYNITTIPDPFNTIPHKIYLEEKDFSLQEAVVVADHFTREQKLKAFREYFLGDDRAAKLCRILNEDDIRFFYNSRTKTLSAFCNKPIMIQNGYLGYEQQFNLTSFSVRYRDKTLNNSEEFLFEGTLLFTDLASNDRKMKKRRADIYKESTSSFFKSFMNGTLTKSGWQVLNRLDKIDASQYFDVQDTLAMKLIGIKPGTNLNRSMHGISEPVAGNISVIYKKKLQSRIVFFTESVWADHYGNVRNGDKILYIGHFSQQRIAKRLPLDFVP